MSLTITLLGTGSPMPSPDRAGPATLISSGEGAGAEHYLVDAGRGVLMRLAALGLGAPNLTAVLLTHLHSDHITDLNDVITTRWVMTFEPTPLTIVGPVGTQQVVDHIVASLEPDIGYRIGHHEDLTYGFTEDQRDRGRARRDRSRGRREDHVCADRPQTGPSDRRVPVRPRR